MQVHKFIGFRHVDKKRKSFHVKLLSPWTWHNISFGPISPCYNAHSKWCLHFSSDWAMDSFAGGYTILWDYYSSWHMDSGKRRGEDTSPRFPQCTLLCSHIDGWPHTWALVLIEVTSSACPRALACVANNRSVYVIFLIEVYMQLCVFKIV
jgi:hypothetical protein